MWLRMAQRARKSLVCKIVSTLVGLLFVVAIFNTGYIKNQLNSWKLLPQSEHLTELYFLNPNTLPATYQTGQSQTVTFVVHNLEGKPVTYSYKIVSTNGNEQLLTVFTQGSFRLNDGQYTTKMAIIHFTDIGQHAKVVVELTNVNESIDYWINRSGP
jgi:hypothetical protein